MTKFTCKFSARVAKTGKKIERTFKVEARDTYHAVDLVVERIGKRYADYINPVFKFNQPKAKMSSALRDVVEGAGPDEE